MNLGRDKFSLDSTYSLISHLQSARAYLTKTLGHDKENPQKTKLSCKFKFNANISYENCTDLEGPSFIFRSGEESFPKLDGWKTGRGYTEIIKKPARPFGEKSTINMNLKWGEVRTFLADL